MDIKSVTRAELERWLVEHGEQSYRAAQVLGWVYRRGEADFTRMINVPLEVRSRLARDFTAQRLARLRVACAADGTRKYVFGLPDGRRVESVLIPDGARLTLCVSSQVGCAMGCTFCATARVKPVRNLRADEIVGQVWELSRELGAQTRVTNLVFMGMGEPLANYDNVARAITILTAPWGMGFSSRRVTVSTVGLIPNMRRLIEETGAQLAVSLTATTSAAREALMPVSRRYPLDELLRACRELPLPARRRVTFEYVLLAGVNDGAQDAARLVRLLRGVRSKVNLIPFHPFPGAPYAPSPPQRLARFRDALLAGGLHATVRESRGLDIQAACGQLAEEGGRYPADSGAWEPGATTVASEAARGA